ncbi:MAG: hypothetical protein NTZ83_04910, partial [Candidatus Pacearchaeota archaeon]|nr:hypothetical protein [Candidatus Pacearchaeota archaeon]
RGDFQFQFAWIFAILAGMFILFLAIYGVIKFVNIQKTSIGAQTAMSIGVLINPLESGFESEKRDIIDAHAETRIYTDCSNTSIFGKQIIRTSEKSYKKWGEELVNVSFQNRYIFSKNPVEGRTFYLFSKPLEFPFKVADLVYLTSTQDKYCFINPPDDIEDQINDLRGDEEEEVSENENFFLADRKSECPTGSTTICFHGEKCDATVSTNPISKYVQKRSERMYYEGDALMYAAIFSSKEDYECQLDRLMNRTEQLFEIYSDKAKFILQETGCNTELDVELMQMLALIKGFEESWDLPVIYSLAEDMGEKNDNAGYEGCKLW